MVSKTKFPRGGGGGRARRTVGGTGRHTLALLAMDVAEILLQAGVGNAARAGGHGAAAVGLAAGDLAGAGIGVLGGSEAGEDGDDGKERELHGDGGDGGE